MGTRRSTLTTAVATALVTALLVGGLQAALASGAAPRAVNAGDFYSRTNSKACPDGGADCNINKVAVNCDAGDIVIGGNGYAKNVSGEVANTSVLNAVDLPNKKTGWKVADRDGVVQAGWSLYVKVYCANTA